MHKITVRALAALAAGALALGLTPGAAHAAQPRDTITIGPVTVCKVVTVFDVVIFEYDCYVEG